MIRAVLEGDSYEKNIVVHVMYVHYDVTMLCNDFY